MKIDIAVVSYNTRNLLQRFLSTLDTNNRDAYNLFISDNYSTDGTVDFLKNYPVNGEVIYNQNIGYAAACNQLASLGDAEIIGLLNADVWFPHPNHIDWILDIFRHFPEIHIMGPKQRNEQNQVVHAGIFGTNTQPRHRGWGQHDPNDLMYRDLIPAVTVSGSAYFIRRTTWETLASCPKFREVSPNSGGAFLLTPHYYEETFASYHARAHNFGVYYCGTFGSLGHTWHASSTVGGYGEQNFHVSQEIFRNACRYHEIDCD